MEETPLIVSPEKKGNINKTISPFEQHPIANTFKNMGLL